MRRDYDPKELADLAAILRIGKPEMTAEEAALAAVEQRIAAEECAESASSVRTLSDVRNPEELEEYQQAFFERQDLMRGTWAKVIENDAFREWMGKDQIFLDNLQQRDKSQQWEDTRWQDNARLTYGESLLRLIIAEPVQLSSDRKRSRQPRRETFRRLVAWRCYFEEVTRTEERSQAEECQRVWERILQGKIELPYGYHQMRELFPWLSATELSHRGAEVRADAKIEGYKSGGIPPLKAYQYFCLCPVWKPAYGKSRRSKVPEQNTK